MRLAAIALVLMLAACGPAPTPPADPAPEPAAPVAAPAVVDSTAPAVSPVVPTAGTVVPDSGTRNTPSATPRAAPSQPPARAHQYRADMTRSAYRVFGPSAPVSTLAAQIHQESGWRIDAVSHVGAQGLAQFMPATAADMARNHPAECAPADPYSARWAFTCRDHYMRTRLDAINPMGEHGLDECDEWVFALRAYNGGLGWIQRDRRLALSRGLDPDNHTEVERVNAGRNAAAFRENIEYAPKILSRQPSYVSAGWGRGVCS